LPIQDWVGSDFHVIQFWEELADPIPVTEHPAAEVYQILVNRFRERADPSGQLPIGMLEVLEGLSVRTYRDGKADYVLFEPLDSLGGNMTDIPVRVHIEYDCGHTKLGMGEGYTLGMLAQEFWALTHNSWDLYPGASVAREIDSTIRHGATNNAASFHNSSSTDSRGSMTRHVCQFQGRPSRAPPVLGLGETRDSCRCSILH
jgi:hypothetical protein